MTRGSFCRPVRPTARLLSACASWTVQSAGRRPALLFPAKAGRLRSYHTSDLHPHTYTDYRWLHRDREQRDARHVQFDFEALCTRVLEMNPGAEKVTKCEKKEGMYNRVFIFSFDNNSQMVARIPFRIAGPAFYSVSSEIATMEYLRMKTSTPIPRVLDWCNDASKIGTEYIIMEHAKGRPLVTTWSELNTLQHYEIIKSVADIMRQMAGLSLPAYGSIYFEDTLTDSQKVTLGDGYCVGPHTATRYWDCDPLLRRTYARRSPNWGPWHNIQEYAESLIDAGIAELPDNSYNGSDALPYQGSIDEVLRLLEQCRGIITQLLLRPQVSSASAPTLLHLAPHARNIYVSEEDPTQITAIIDWRATGAEPLFTYIHEEPDIVRSAPHDFSSYEMELDLEELDEEDDPPEVIAKGEKDKEICQNTFNTCLREWIPALYPAKTANSVFFRLFRFVPIAWSAGASAIQQELIEVSQEWKFLGLPGESTLGLSSEKLKGHEKRLEDLEAKIFLRFSLERMLNANPHGRRPLKGFLRAERLLQAEYEEWMTSSLESYQEGDSEFTADCARKVWPWDGNGKLKSSVTW